MLTTLCEIAGFAAITAGAFLLADWAGFIVGGASLVTIGWLAGRKP